MTESIDFTQFTPGISGMLKIRVNKAGAMAQPYYKSYMLRIWREETDGSWRATLESVTSGEVRAFGELDQLMAFLSANEVERPSFFNPDDDRPARLPS